MSNEDSVVYLTEEGLEKINEEIKPQYIATQIPEVKSTFTLGDALKYIEKNEDQREVVLNYLLDPKNNSIDYSNKTIDNLFYVLEKYAVNNPDGFKDEILTISKIGLGSNYRQEILNELTAKEKLEILSSASRDQARGYINDAGEIISDSYDKFQETKLYGKIEGASEKVKDTVNEGIRKTGQKLYEMDLEVGE